MCKEGAYWGKIAIKIDGLYFVHAAAKSLSVVDFVQELLPEYMLEWSMEWKGSVAPGIG